MRLYNLARMSTSTTGTGTITLGSAVSGYLSFANAGVANGDIVCYGIKDGANSEVGYGTYTSSGTTLSRTSVINSTNAGSAISLSGSAEVFVTALAENFPGAMPNCRLVYTNSTTLTLKKVGGNRIKINKQWYYMPSTDATLGTGGLSTSTLYYVYAYISAGAVTLEASTTTHATSTASGNEGVEIKSGDETRTLVGMARTNGSTQFVDSAAQRFVISYHNRTEIAGSNNFTTSRTTTTTSPWVEINSEIRCEFLTWADDAVTIISSGSWFNSGASTCVSSIGIDGTTAEDTTSFMTGVSAQPLSITQISKYSEGYHYATILGYVSAGTGTWYVNTNSAGLRTVLKIKTRG